jgi:hypothetical protein
MQKAIFKNTAPYPSTAIVASTAGSGITALKFSFAMRFLSINRKIIVLIKQRLQSRTNFE